MLTPYVGCHPSDPVLHVGPCAGLAPCHGGRNMHPIAPHRHDAVAIPTHLLEIGGGPNLQRRTEQGRSKCNLAVLLQPSQGYIRP